MNDRDFAVVVAINRYRDGQAFRELGGPINDATDFIDWLVSPSGGHLPADHVFQKLSVADGSSPTSSDVAWLLGEIFSLQHAEDQPIGRRLYVFLAGHGFTPAANLALLHTADSRRSIPAYVSGLQWADCFFMHALFDEVVLCMDCCRDSEPLFQPPPVPCPNRLDAAANQVKRLYLMATGIGTKAFEREIDGKVRGVFSHAFVSALKGDAVDGAGRIMASTVVDVVRRKFHAEPGTTQSQFPSPILPVDFVLFDNLPPQCTPVRITSSDNLPLKVYAGDDSARQHPIEPSSTLNGVAVFDLPRDRTYLAIAVAEDGKTRGFGTFALHDVPLEITV